MADDFRVYIKGAQTVKRSMTNLEREANRAQMWAVREAGRRTTRVAKKKAPVLGQGRGITRKEQKDGGNPRNQPVRGLLRASIKSSRRLFREGASVAVHVAPRGERVHLYSQKIEALYGYMAEAHDAVAPQLREIAERAMARVIRGRH